MGLIEEVPLAGLIEEVPEEVPLVLVTDVVLSEFVFPVAGFVLPEVCAKAGLNAPSDRANPAITKNLVLFISAHLSR